jgi:ABC-type molybdenum transport system ATPase subunit/photorepair protein PhrA
MKNSTQQLQQLNPSLHISSVELPENHTLNDMWVNYGLNGINKLLKERINLTEGNTAKEQENALKLINEGKLAYEVGTGTYYVLGELSTDLSTLKASLHFEEQHSKRKHRNKIDLYDRGHVLHFAKTISEAEHMDINEIESDLLKLTDLLEAYREKQHEALHPSKSKKNSNVLLPEKEKEAQLFLSQPNLLENTDKLIELSGITGETSNRLLVFIIASTYKMLNPLHALVQGTSGSGKTHLINAIASLMPPEDILNMTRVTSKSFYHYSKDELINKLVLIQDMDGLDEEAKYAFREMQSAGQVSSSTTYKDKFGNLQSTVKTVNASFASLSATTHAEIYYDNMSRSIVLGIDESPEQTQRIIQQQNKKLAGLTDEVATRKAKELLQNCMRILKPYEVVNRYANKIQLPVEAKMLRRLNNHYQSFVSQITILHQYQRQKDEQGRLIATVEDLKLACEILFDAIMWKIDELDSSLRQVFEQMKDYVRKQGNAHPFTAREIRQQLNLSKSQCFRYIEELKKLEYIQASEGSANRGFRYTIAYFDNMQMTREKVKTGLMEQLSRL